MSDGVDHHVLHAFYVMDPDANVVELGVDIPGEQWSDVADPYAADKPLQIVPVDD